MSACQSPLNVTLSLHPSNFPDIPSYVSDVLWFWNVSTHFVVLFFGSFSVVSSVFNDYLAPRYLFSDKGGFFCFFALS